MAINLYSKVRVTKANLFAKIIEVMTDAGWEIISGSVATGDPLLKSTGETGDRTLAVLLNPWIYSEDDAHNLNVNGNGIQAKFPGMLDETTATYPSFNNFSKGSFYFPIMSNINTSTYLDRISAISPCPYPNMEVDLYYYCNKDKLVCVS